ncbi:hypothetical protein AB0G02_32215 [Actinosynnema sp. NPDC023658]|uniref:hypothetical protein n=1 Tax=Actinosynnema sp. NPDC023658 TaxID=3155465 RepID=UPI0033C049A5
MEIAALAAQAVGLISTYLANIAIGTTDKLAESAVAGLHRLIAARLGRTKLGQAVLEGWQEQPSAPERQKMATFAITEEANTDAGFANQLTEAVKAVWVSQGAADQATIQNQVNLSAGGAVTMKKSLIAGGSITQTRATKFTLGGLALVIIATVVLVAMLNSGNSDRPGLDPGAQIQDIGTDPSKEGALQSARAFLDGASVGNPEIVCKLSHKVPANCAEQFRQEYEKMSPEQRDAYKNAEIRSVEIRNNGTLEAEVEFAMQDLKRDGAPMERKRFNLFYVGGRWQINEISGYAVE